MAHLPVLTCFNFDRMPFQNADQIREHFSRFGKIESIEMNGLNVSVRFKNKEGADIALQQQDHRISNRMVHKRSEQTVVER